jgi:DNA end-binding protein Ku
MPHAIWSGAISFGLVNVPVRMYSAIETKDLEFDLIHEKDGGHVGYQTYCKLEEEPVPREEIVKGYEVADGEYVYVTDDDFAAAEVEGYKSIDIETFVPYDDIDPIYFERTYYLGPQDGSEHVYALLLKAMEQSGLAGIARYVMRSREHLGCLRTRDGVITLEKMYFSDEIRPADEIAPSGAKVEKRELQMAAELIDRFTGSWQPEKYRDTYRERLLDVIEAKRKGEEVHAERVREPEEPPDIMEALRASLEATKSRRSPPKKKGRSSSSGPKRRERSKSSRR